MKTQLALVKCDNYDFNLVYNSVKRAIELLGGIEKFIKPEAKVLIKPNLLQAVSPQQAVTTHPILVKAVIKILKGIKCKIYLGDSPSSWFKVVNFEELYARCGMKTIAEEESIELVDFKHPVWKNNFPLTNYLDFCDYFISLPKFKTHDLTILTAAVKNLFGLVCGVYKIELHRRYLKKEDFCKMLIDLYEVAKPHLTIVDGIVSLEGDGPGTSGIPKNTGFILAGVDCIAIDSILALIMGLKPLDILTNLEAKRRGLGITELKDIEILGDKLEEFLNMNFKLPATSLIKKVPLPILEIAKKMIRFYPKIKPDKCVLCGNCVRICPVKAMTIKNKKVRVDYSKCISCFCCQETCLYSAINIKTTILAKIIGL
jgi:uncharacterized protein (DUF362 family)/Pyruvate/2-oxoacid:ferredoxin oxidoreductase delta subunit